MSKSASPESLRARIDEHPELASAFAEGQAGQLAANLITEMREDAGLSKKQLAEELGVSASRIHEAENPKGPQGPTYRFLADVARACGFVWPRSVADLKRAPKHKAPARKPATKGRGSRPAARSAPAFSHDALAEYIAGQVNISSRTALRAIVALLRRIDVAVNQAPGNEPVRIGTDAPLLVWRNPESGGNKPAVRRRTKVTPARKKKSAPRRVKPQVDRG